MAYFQLADRQITLRDGDMTVGSGAGMDIVVPGDHGAAAVAFVTTKGDGAVTVRRGFDGAPVKVNGVQLGVEPTPLIHGDKLEVAGAELNFGDDKKSGSTQFLSGAELAELAKLRQQMAAGGAKSATPTASTGGRIVSLTDGREYAIPAKGLVFGRDASCDVVIASGEVSRAHAEISSGPDGYYVIDTSTNGIWVNSKRVDGTQTLGRADVIRMGPEEFRFYADKAAASASAVTASPTPAIHVPAIPLPVAAPPMAAPAVAPPKAPVAVAAPAPAPTPAVAAPVRPRDVPTAAPSPSQKGSPSLMFILGVVAVAAAVAYFLLK